jgi:hypothetical protein
MTRALRIAGFALGFAFVFTLSQRATLARYGETLPGISWAIGALSAFFLIGAWATERTQGAEANARKDLLWGLGAGGIIIVLSRL